MRLLLTGQSIVAVGRFRGRDRGWQGGNRAGTAVRCRRGTLATHDDRRLVVRIGPARQAVPDSVDQARPCLPLRGRFGAAARLIGSWPLRGASGGLRLGVATVVPAGEVRRDEVTDGHVEVQQQADDRHEEQHNPRSRGPEGALEHGADAHAQHSPTLAAVDRCQSLGVDPTAPTHEVEHPEQREREHCGARGCHPALGRHRLHPQHHRKTGEQRRGERDPPPEQRGEQVVPGLDDRAGGWREQRDDAQDGEEQQDQRDPLAHEPAADDERRRLTPPPRGPASGRRPPSCRHPGQTSITIGRIIGRRLVRWWKKRLSVSRILVLT